MLTAGRSSLPANDQTFEASAPMVHGFGWIATTAAGPADHLSVPWTSPGVVGRRKGGPAPEITSPPVGERKNDGAISPSPKLRPPLAASTCDTSGTMVRDRRRRRSLNLMGITGWMLSVFWVCFRGPTSKSMLFWNGTEMRSATG